MQIKNDYKIPWKRAKTGEEGTGIFNGDLGTVERIDLAEQEVIVLLTMSARPHTIIQCLRN